jgi:hypothetical protein
MIALLLLLGGVWALALFGGTRPAKWILGLVLLAELAQQPQIFTGAMDRIAKLADTHVSLPGGVKL